MSELDPRCHAIRTDLADERLRDQVTVPRYTEGARRMVIAPAVPVRREPRPDALLDTEALFGETVLEFDEHEGWSWVQLAEDGYVGYCPSAALTGEHAVANNRVAVLRTFVFPAPDIKTPPILDLPMNAVVAAVQETGNFLGLATGGFVYADHVKPRGVYERDFVAIAERFIGTPYLWGGRTVLGIDCSALVQIALGAAGRSAPRDSDMQAADLGDAVDFADGLPPLRRRDLVFWPKHVGIMLDQTRLLHANAHHLMVEVEPLAETIARHAEFGLHVSAIRRL